jgi:hypothetical protein
MNTVRAAQVTKSGNPLSGKPPVELTLRAMPPAAEVSSFENLLTEVEVAA